jgi:hypothetical protein
MVITVLTPAITQGFGFTAAPIGQNYILIFKGSQQENQKYRTESLPKIESENGNYGNLALPETAKN